MLCPAAQPLCDHKHQGHRHNFSPGLSLVVTNAIGVLNKAAKPHFYCVSLSCEKKNGIQSHGPCFQGPDSLGGRRLTLCANGVNQPVLSTFTYLPYARNHPQR